MIELWKRMSSRRRAATAAVMAGAMVLLIASWWGMFQLGRASMSPADPAQSAASEDTRAAQTTPPTAAPTAETPLYIVGVWNSRLAVYLPPAALPDQVYDVYIINLPEEVQRELEEGIAVYDEATLASLLDDFTG